MLTYIERTVDTLIDRLLSELPALLIVGPRATGKTTTASRHAATVVRLDRPREAVAFRADPDAALSTLEEPVLLDEWQAVPEILGAVKRSVDTYPRPGRYLLTGSVRADLDATTWPGTGRLLRVPMFGMTEAEHRGRAQTVPLIDRLARGHSLRDPVESLDLRSYVEHALCSGFPQAALSESEDVRSRWIESYIEQLLTRDAKQIEERDPAKLRRFFEAYALNTAGVVEDRTLFEAAGINRKTAVAYEQLLINLMVIQRIEPWASNRLKRLVRSPKRCLTDAALVAGILRLDASAIIRDGFLLGRFLETFVMAQLRAELSISEHRPRLFHLRQEEGRHEVDLIVELGGGRVIAIEIKADSAPGRSEAKHLLWLRDNLGDRFVCGVVLHTGDRVFDIDDRIIAAPIAVLWDEGS